MIYYSFIRFGLKNSVSHNEGRQEKDGGATGECKQRRVNRRDEETRLSSGDVMTKRRVKNTCTVPLVLAQQRDLWSEMAPGDLRGGDKRL